MAFFLIVFLETIVNFFRPPRGHFLSLSNNVWPSSGEIAPMVSTASCTFDFLTLFMCMRMAMADKIATIATTTISSMRANPHSFFMRALPNPRKSRSGLCSIHAILAMLPFRSFSPRPHPNSSPLHYCCLLPTASSPSKDAPLLPRVAHERCCSP